MDHGEFSLAFEFTWLTKKTPLNLSNPNLEKRKRDFCVYDQSKIGAQEAHSDSVAVQQ